LVSEIPGGGLPHPRNAQVFAKVGGRFDVEVVERHDAIDLSRPRNVADAFHEVVAPDVAGDVEELTDRLTRPVGVTEGVRGEQQDAMPLPRTLAKKLLALLVGRNAENRQPARA